MHVGIRTLGWKGSQFGYVGGRWRRAYFFEVVQHELHPTKGWRFLRRTRKAVPEDIWNKAPATERRFERTQPILPRGPTITLSPEAMERARMRHAWYRRQKAAAELPNPTTKGEVTAMNYDQAKAIAAEHAPNLLIDDDGGHPHIVVRKAKNGHPFSIMLPVSTDAVPRTEEQERKLFTDALDAAVAHQAATGG